MPPDESTTLRRGVHVRRKGAAPGDPTGHGFVRAQAVHGGDRWLVEWADLTDSVIHGRDIERDPGVTMNGKG
jgi:hypothetical protein